MSFVSKSKLLKLFNFWPPFFAAGIRIKKLSPDFRAVDVKMKLRFWNKNYVGTHYGGSLYSMTDPFYMLMLIENLGPDYVVWDKAATIHFKRPGRGAVSANFRLSQNQIEEIKNILETHSKYEPVFTVHVLDSEQKVICEVTKTLHIKKKNQ